MKVKITALPEMKMGGILADYPYAGNNHDIVPFGNINSDTESDDINTNASAKPIDREDANLEAEKGELLLKFDLGGLFTIQGKRHSEGGTPLNADAGDFIFSRDKDLAITKKEKELFGFKEGGTYKKMENTPAKVLASEVNPKHYNQLLNIIKDPKADDFAKKTAELMLGKYSTKIGQVAYLQESKKGFPNGLPNFTEGTAPIQSQELEGADAKEDQYARYGGRMGDGGKVRRNDQLPPNYQPPYQKAFIGPQEEINDWGKSLEPFGFSGDTGNVNAIQQWINLNAPASAPYVYKNGLFGLNNKQYDPQRKDYSDQYVRDQFNDGKYAEDAWTFANHSFPDRYQYDNFIQQATPVGRLPTGDTYYDAQLRNKYNKPVFEIPQDDSPLQSIPLAQSNLSIPSPALQMDGSNGTINANVTPAQRRAHALNGYDNSLPWNAQEKLTTALPFLDAFMRKDQYPMLQQIHTPDIRLDRVSNAQELSDIRQQSSLSQNELFNNVDGRTASLNAAGLRADLINNIGRSNSQNNNTNTQISNQEDQTNYQQMINDRNFNVQALGKNYDENNLVLGRRQKEMADAFAQSINTGIGIQDKLDALKQNLAQSSMKTLDKNGQPRFVLDPNTRQPVLNPNWHGSIIDNPFLGQSKDSFEKSYQATLAKALTGDKNAIDLLKVLAYTARSNKYGSSLNNIYNP